MQFLVGRLRIGGGIEESAPQCARGDVRTLQQEHDARLPRAKNSATSPRPQPSHGANEGALARTRVAADQHVLAWRDHDFGSVDHDPAARLRNRQSFDVEGIVRAVSDDARRSANGLGMFISRAPIWLSAFAGLCAAVIIALNAKLIWDQLMS